MAGGHDKQLSYASRSQGIFNVSLNTSMVANCGLSELAMGAVDSG